MFRVGQKVICINVGPSRFTGCTTSVLELGAVYTVRRVFLNMVSETTAVLLDEVGTRGRHNGFDANRFRPVVDRPTDISVFTDMLRRVGDKVPA